MKIKTPHYCLVAVGCIATGIVAWAVPGDDHDHNHPPAAPSTQKSSGKSDAHDDHAHDDHAPTVKPADPHSGHDHGDHGHTDAHADEVTLTPEAIKRYDIQIGKVRKQVMASEFVAPARVAFNADAMAHVGSSVTGRVADLKIKLGDAVKKGDVLAVIDSPELGESQSDFLLKNTAADTARPAVQLAKNAYDRAKQLLDLSQGIALAEVQKREADLRTAEGALRTAESSATAAENKLHLYGMSQDSVATLLKTGEIAPQYRVLAPIDGQILEREVTLGELVRPDRDALLIIADLSKVWVIADVPEARIGEVGKGSVSRVKVATLKGKVLEGTVTYIAPALDSNTRSAKVRIEIKDDNGVLRPGMFAHATISPPATDAAEAVLAVPEEAIQTVEGGPAVFVPCEGEPNTFAKRAVTIGKPAAGMVQVLTGLNEGDSVIVSGSFILKAELGKNGAAHEH